METLVPTLDDHPTNRLQISSQNLIETSQDETEKDPRITGAYPPSLYGIGPAVATAEGQYLHSSINPALVVVPQRSAN